MAWSPEGYFGVNGVTKGWKPILMIQNMDGCSCQNKCASAFNDVSNSRQTLGWDTRTYLRKNPNQPQEPNPKYSVICYVREIFYVRT